MGNQIIKNIEPLGFQWKAMDPFLFCVHHEDNFPKGNENMAPDPSLLAGRQIGADFETRDGWRMYHGKTVPGFPVHPHRGFETVTIVRKGLVDHTDSMGAAGRFGNGDVQWMTAGKGIQHAEMFPLLNQDAGNPLELFQIWLNLPKKGKFVEPYFKMFWADDIPKYTHTGENGKNTMVEVIAGKLQHENPPSPPPDSWAAREQNEVVIWNIHMEAGATWTFPTVSGGTNRRIYFYKGDQLNIEGSVVPSYHSADLTLNNSYKVESGNEKCNILILQGKPINEPVVQQGPFVMNSRLEIQQAYDDYQKTQFGGWPWPDHGPVHPKEQGRFAKHGDGKTEIKG